MGMLVSYLAFPRYVTEQITSSPIVIKGETEVKTEYKLVEPEQKGEVTRIINRDSKVYVVVDGKEYEIKDDKSQTKDITLGDNGTVQVVQQTEAKVDLTELFNQRLNAEIEKQRLQSKLQNKQNELSFNLTNHGKSVRLTHDLNSRISVNIEASDQGHYGAGIGFKF